MHICSDTPPAIAQALGDSAQLCVRSDLALDGSTADFFIALAGNRLVTGDAESVTETFDLSACSTFSIEELHGRARILTTYNDTEIMLCQYSADLIAEFASVCRALNQVRDGHEPLLPENVEVIRDPESGMPLRQRGDAPSMATRALPFGASLAS